MIERVYRHSKTLWFYQDNVAAGQTAVQLTCLGDAARTEYPMLRPGLVIGVIVWSNDARATGWAKVDPTINGTATGVQANIALGGQVVAYNVTGSTQFTIGQRIGVELTSHATWTPETADFIVGVEVTYK